MSSKIPIYVSNQKAYVWTVRDVTELRVKHRICGTLVGTLPHLAQQNFFLGLPLILMPEEVVLLMENGEFPNVGHCKKIGTYILHLEAAVLVDDSTPIRDPSAEELTGWDKERKREVALQQTAYEREKVHITPETTNRKGKGRMSEEAILKRNQRKEKRGHSPCAGTGEELSEIATIANSQSQASELRTQKPTHYTVRIPSTSTLMPWYQPSHYDDLASAKCAGLWTYPRSLQERASCQVFRYLWEKGHFLGSGIKFGGDFLVYPGDPLRYHSHFVASVVHSPTAVLRPMEIVAHGRLGTATKKAHLLCGWDEEKQKISCFSIEWSGFG